MKGTDAVAIANAIAPLLNAKDTSTITAVDESIIKDNMKAKRQALNSVIFSHATGPQ